MRAAAQLVWRPVSGRASRGVLGAGAAMLLLGFLAGAAPAARAASFSWGEPVPVDNQPPFVHGSAGRLSALSCPSTGLCVAASSTNLVS